MAIEACCRDHGLERFIVGNYGSFDRLAKVALLRAKKRYPDVRLYMLIPYHPADRPTQAPEGFDGTFYPPLESVPKRYAIVHANRYMVLRADHVICCVRHPGNTRNLLKLAGSKGIPICNLME